jgi:hypothetical protein
MVNENHFRFDRKSFFNFWKTIYSFKNRKSFFEIKLFVLALTFDIRLSESGNGWSSKFRPGQNPASSGHRNTVVAGIRPPSPDTVKPDSGQNWPESGHDQNPAGSGQNGRNPAGSSQTCSSELLPDSGDSCIFAFRNFFVRTKRSKIFSRKSFFLKIIS